MGLVFYWWYLPLAVFCAGAALCWFITEKGDTALHGLTGFIVFLVFAALAGGMALGRLL